MAVEMNDGNIFRAYKTAFRKILYLWGAYPHTPCLDVREGINYNHEVFILKNVRHL